MNRSTRTIALSGVSACLVAAALFPAVPANAGDTCSDPQTDKVTTTKGQRVWIPSSRKAGPFQFGGSQSISTTDGELKARTSGSADTVGGSGGINIGMFKAEAKYEHQWNRSTTVTNTFSQTFTTNSPEMPNSVNWRWRLYMKGYLFVATRTTTYPAPCAVTERTIRKRFALPASGKTFSFDVETYKKRGWLHDIDGKPFKP